MATVYEAENDADDFFKCYLWRVEHKYRRRHSDSPSLMQFINNEYCITSINSLSY